MVLSQSSALPTTVYVLKFDGSKISVMSQLTSEKSVTAPWANVTLTNTTNE